jgi:hypothetical protein
MEPVRTRATVYAKGGTFECRGNSAGIFDDSLVVVGAPKRRVTRRDIS